MRKDKSTDTPLPIVGALALGMMFATVNASTGGTGYLARIGPSALRFQSLPTVRTSVVLPPIPSEKAFVAPTNLPTHSTISAAETNDTTFAPFAEYSLWPGATGVSHTNSGSSENDQSQPGSSESPQNAAEAPAMPQVFLDYFRPTGPYQGSTNAAGYSVGVPVNFAFPVSPPVTPSSHAIYRSE